MPEPLIGDRIEGFEWLLKDAVDALRPFNPAGRDKRRQLGLIPMIAADIGGPTDA